MNLTFAMLPAERQTEVLPLLIRCFPDYWGVYRNAKQFPIRERSFVALDGEHIAGHIGLIEFSTAGKDGEILNMGGIASVAVDPDYRKRGIAAALCAEAIAWSKANGIDMLPLYTALTNVYAGIGWRVFTPFPAKSIVATVPCAIPARRGMELSGEERARIIEFYQNGFTFPGKVQREESGCFHSWARLFADSNVQFRLWNDGYLLESEGVTIELYGSAIPSEILFVNQTIALPEHHFAWSYIPQNQQCPAVFDPWHQELPMIALSGDCQPPENFFFPPADKF